jgi:hypothetical protein
VLTLKKALESNLTLNLLASALIVFLAGFFWIDLSRGLEIIGINQVIRIAVVGIGILSIYLIWKRVFQTLPILYLVFTGCYFLYQLLFLNTYPMYLIMILLFLLIWLIFPIYQVKEAHGIYFFLLVLTLFEIFLALGYWLVNPISRSLIMAIAAYLFGGWLTTMADKDRRDFSRYLYFSTISFLIVLFTTRWGI